MSDENSTEEQKSAIDEEKVNIKIILLGLVVVILITMGTYLYLSNNNFTLRTTQNREFHIKASKNTLLIDELKGKIVFLKVFGWNCHYCQKEIPELIKLKNRFKTVFDTLAIEYQHHSDRENLDFIHKYHINYNIINGDNQIEFLNYLKKEYKWNGVIPLTVVIDAKGRILAFEVGYKSYSLTTLLQTTLKRITTVAQ